MCRTIGPSATGTRRMRSGRVGKMLPVNGRGTPTEHRENTSLAELCTGLSDGLLKACLLRDTEETDHA